MMLLTLPLHSTKSWLPGRRNSKQHRSRMWPGNLMASSCLEFCSQSERSTCQSICWPHADLSQH